MIVVDIECSGANYEKCGIVEIGAVDINNSKNTFCESARLGDEDFVINNPGANKSVLEILGTTEERLRDKGKQDEKDLLEHFFKWCKKMGFGTLICQHPQFDLAFLEQRARKYGLEFPISYKAFDLHTIAQLKWFNLNGCFNLEGDFSNLGLSNILEFVGMPDNRKAHNALEDARLEAECFFRLVRGNALFLEYKQFSIPDYLKKEGE